MLKINLSSDLFKQIGGTNWVARPGYFANQKTAEMVKTELDSDNHENDAKNLVEQSPEFEVVSDVTAKEEEAVTSYLESSPMVTDVIYNAPEAITTKELVTSIVVIGRGLDSIWQNEESLAWQLFQNIMKVFSWDETQVVFFDTELIVTEDSLFNTMEEVIDLGVELVLCMDDEHEIYEQLSEGVHVVSVPDFELMLSDPHAKQSFYHSIVSINLHA